MERLDGDWPALLAARDGAALADLRAVLCKGLTKSLAGKPGAALAEDFAQEAVLKVLDALPAFRGDSRFLTWALAIAVRVAFTELRKARWKDVPLAHDVPEPKPAEEPEALAVLRRLIDTDLTDKQRSVIRWELDGVPQAVIAERMGTSRNALYKLGHDARMKLKRGLLAAGFSAEEAREA